MYNLISIKPTKTYKSKDNAIKAVEKAFSHLDPKKRHFNVAILTSEDGRFFPLILNIDQAAGGFQEAINSGFNLVN